MNESIRESSSYLSSFSSSSSSRFLRVLPPTRAGFSETALLALYIDSYSCNAMSCQQLWFDAEITHLYLSQESTVRRDAIPSILNSVQRILPIHLIILHHVHHHERRRQADAPITMHQHTSTILQRIINELFRSMKHILNQPEPPKRGHKGGCGVTEETYRGKRLMRFCSSLSWTSSVR